MVKHGQGPLSCAHCDTADTGAHRDGVAGARVCEKKKRLEPGNVQQGRTKVTRDTAMLPTETTTNNHWGYTV